MISLGAFAVFALGLRHGADPDHIAAIDNLTRNAFDERPRMSRFCGALFAGGHSVMVLGIATLVGILGKPLAAHGSLIESIGTWISIVILVMICHSERTSASARRRTHKRCSYALFTPSVTHCEKPLGCSAGRFVIRLWF